MLSFGPIALVPLGSTDVQGPGASSLLSNTQCHFPGLLFQLQWFCLSQKSFHPENSELLNFPDQSQKIHVWVSSDPSSRNNTLDPGFSISVLLACWAGSSWGTVLCIVGCLAACLAYSSSKWTTPSDLQAHVAIPWDPM